jgi:hypothetical protein
VPTDHGRATQCPLRSHRKIAIEILDAATRVDGVDPVQLRCPEIQRPVGGIE